MTERDRPSVRGVRTRELGCDLGTEVDDSPLGLAEGLSAATAKVLTVADPEDVVRLGCCDIGGKPPAPAAVVDFTEPFIESKLTRSEERRVGKERHTHATR